ncbi:MAG: cysteine desulfurase family protein [Chlamydiota bacterium]|nr:cysteine desulfurase family protein [Chlamydiota bacterium]
MEERIYLDNNASTHIDPKVLEAVIDVLKNFPGNPSSMHTFGQALGRKMTAARDLIAKHLNVRNREIIFTSGASEGMNMLLKGFFDGNYRGHIITSDLEHPCVYNTVKYLEGKGVEVTYLSPGKYGAPKPEDVQNAIRPDTRLVALMAANNETGVKTDINAISALLSQHEIPFFVDAVAYLGKENFFIPDGVTAMVFSGHKIHAPKGIGFVFLRKSQKITPLLVGGGHEYGLRAGTENVSDIVGLAKAVQILDEVLPAATKRVMELRDFFEKEIIEQLGDVLINGEGPRVCNTSNLSFPGVEGETLLANLDMQGIAVSHGSACASGALEPSRVILNMGATREEARSSIRFSLSRYTTRTEIERAISIIVSNVNRLRKTVKNKADY